MRGWSSLQPGPALPPALEWSTAIAQVASAVGTLAAVAVALWIAISDSRRIQAEQADREARQARLVTFEVYRRGDRWRVGITNQSMAPIFEVTVTRVTCGDYIGYVEAVPGSPARLAVAPAGARLEQTIKFENLASDPPADPTDEATSSCQASGSCQVSATFLDAAGLRWSRTGSRPPQRILSQAPS